jgi:hypothetical protein
MTYPDYKALLMGAKAFAAHEGRDAMYKVASFLIAHFWGRPGDVADGLGTLLLTWNQAFYSYGRVFSFDALEDCIRREQDKLSHYRSRLVESFDPSEAAEITNLFTDFLAALERTKDGVRSPVGVAKALHLLAPGFFPLWDNAIAEAYGCMWRHSDGAALEYIRFLQKSRDACFNVIETCQQQYGVDAQHARQMVCSSLYEQWCGIRPPSEKTLLKVLDEYNYAKYTKHWIE